MYVLAAVVALSAKLTVLTQCSIDAYTTRWFDTYRLCPTAMLSDLGVAGTD